MAYGALITNQNGDTVFTTEDPTYEVVGKGTITLSYYLSGRTVRYSTDPNYSSTPTRSESALYKNDNAIGGWDDDVLTFLEVKNGERVYRYETYDPSSGTPRSLRVMAYGQSSVRYVQARLATNIAAPTSGHGMVIYDSSGDPTWSSEEVILDNVLPLSQTSTSNRWFFWTPSPAVIQGSLSPCGMRYYRGIIGGSTSFSKEGTNFAYYGITSSAYRDTRFCGLSWDNSTRGFSADIDWDEV